MKIIASLTNVVTKYIWYIQQLYESIPYITSISAKLGYVEKQNCQCDEEPVPVNRSHLEDLEVDLVKKANSVYSLAVNATSIAEPYRNGSENYNQIADSFYKYSKLAADQVNSIYKINQTLLPRRCKGMQQVTVVMQKRILTYSAVLSNMTAINMYINFYVTLMNSTRVNTTGTVRTELSNLHMSAVKLWMSIKDYVLAITNQMKKSNFTGYLEGMIRNIGQACGCRRIGETTTRTTTLLTTTIGSTSLATIGKGYRSIKIEFCPVRVNLVS